MVLGLQGQPPWLQGQLNLFATHNMPDAHTYGYAYGLNSGATRQPRFKKT